MTFEACDCACHLQPTQIRAPRDKPLQARSAQQVAIEVSAGELKTGDVIQVGGRSMAVADLRHITGGAKHIGFQTGDALTITPSTTLVVFRTVEGGRTPHADLRP
ncbi:hypothetical protein MMF93_15860 [Streptomyces tubbatahanensis]|uniref:Uncharacterized protein n=1 Tax=Streptomyces tubbatahanensis TaxID=2923272 RepID=A0ABY3XTH7_9ACTN|nr:hypothetical protein [Streptomyces tubbatahanensis]UNS97783.1 hypothetical protein MMF93_15860 [Streptomyces tubbatahanensis]